MPVARHLAGWPRHGLRSRMSGRRRKLHSLNHLRHLVVPEPVLAWLKAGADGVTSLSSMSGAVLARRAVATTNMSAFRAAAQVQPPAVGCKALHTAGSTWLRLRIDSRMGLHALSPYSCLTLCKPVLRRPTTVLTLGRSWFALMARLLKSPRHARNSGEESWKPSSPHSETSESRW